MTRKQSTLMRERKKSWAKALAEEKSKKVSFVDLENKEKIEELQTYIKNCEYDLKSFPGNKNILEKIKVYKEQINILLRKKDDGVKEESQ